MVEKMAVKTAPQSLYAGIRFKIMRRPLINGIPQPFDMVGEGEFRDLRTYRKQINLASRKSWTESMALPEGVIEVVVKVKNDCYDYDGQLTTKKMIYENK